MKYTGKFETLITESISRFTQGGVLSGDLVRIRKDYMKNEKVKGMTEQFKAMIQNAANTDLNLRVGGVKSTRPTTSGYYGGGDGSGTSAPTDYWIDVVIEYSPGLWRDPMTVPLEILEVVDAQGNLVPVPDSLKRQNNVHGPKKVESPDADRKNPTKNVNQQFNTKTTDGMTQISKPKEMKRDSQGKLTMEKDMSDHPFNKMRERKGEKAMEKIATKSKKDVKDVSVDDIEKYNKKKVQKESTLEDVYEAMTSMTGSGSTGSSSGTGSTSTASSGANPSATPSTGAGATPAATPAVGGTKHTKYTLKFGKPYGKNPDDLTAKMATMPGLSNNLTANVIDDNTIEIDSDADIDDTEFEHMLTNVIQGGVTVSRNPEGQPVTSFNAQQKPTVTLGNKATPQMR